MIDLEVQYLSEDQIEKRIIEASDSLDYKLERAFEFKLYLKKYSSKLRKRFMKIHSFSRFRLFD